MIQLTKEQRERVKQIRDRFGTSRATWQDVGFLLSLLDSDSQVAEPDYRQLARELAMIVDVGTNDDPGTALAKLRKIQHVAATSMRDKCVENLGSLVEGYKNDLFATDDEDYKASLGFAVDALDKAIRSISSLTLEPLEPEKQKL